jgi:DNA repair exonuclease SbcCD ATPase subunit
MTDRREAVRVSYEAQRDEIDEQQAKLGHLRAEVECLKDEVKAAETRSGMANVVEQFEAQLKVERAEAEAQRQRADEAAGELRLVDSAIGNRSAFDGIEGRRNKILKAIEQASRAQAAEQRAKESHDAHIHVEEMLRVAEVRADALAAKVEAVKALPTFYPANVPKGAVARESLDRALSAEPQRGEACPTCKGFGMIDTEGGSREGAK